MSDILRVVVVDDEQLARQELCYLLEGRPDVQVVAEAANGPEAMTAIDRHEPDLVFLDIQMPGLTGFEVARQLLDRGEEAPALVFVTAYDQHAIEAFEVNAVDYLLKPVDAARLEQALQRAQAPQRTGTVESAGKTRIERSDRADRQDDGGPTGPARPGGGEGGRALHTRPGR
jgi:two-component system, LytTR family, response regulator LytT